MVIGWTKLVTKKRKWVGKTVSIRTYLHDLKKFGWANVYFENNVITPSDWNYILCIKMSLMYKNESNNLSDELITKLTVCHWPFLGLVWPLWPSLSSVKCTNYQF